MDCLSQLAGGLRPGGGGGHDLVPAAGWRQGRSGLIGLMLGSESFGGAFCGLELLRLEPRGNIVTLLAGVLVAALGGEREPLVRLRHAAFDPDTARIEDG